MAKLVINNNQFADLLMVILADASANRDVFSGNEEFYDALRKMVNARSVLRQFWLDVDPDTRRDFRRIKHHLTGEVDSELIIRVVSDKAKQQEPNQVQRILNRLVNGEPINKKEQDFIVEMFDLGICEWNRPTELKYL